MKMTTNRIEWLTDQSTGETAFFGKDLGELLSMPFELRRKRMVQALEEQKLVAECCAVSMEQTMDLIRVAVASSAAGISVASPLFFEIHEREMLNYYRKVAEAVPDGTVLYLRCLPQLSNNRISRTVFEKLMLQCPNIAGFIDNTTDATRMLDLSKERNYQLLTDCDAVFEVATLLGYDGLIR